MKINIQKVTGIVFIFLFLSLLSQKAFAWESFDIGSNDAYILPIAVGSQEWKDMDSLQDRRAACSIPGDVLKTISTRGLLQTCIDNPYAWEVFAFNLPLEALEQQILEYNGLKELMARKDVGLEMIKAYRHLSAAKLDENWPLAKKGGYSILNMYMELLITRDEVISSLSESQLTSLLEFALGNLNDKAKLSETYGLGSLISNSFLMAKILRALQFEPFLKAAETNKDIQNLETSFRADKDVVKVIETLAKDCLDERKEIKNLPNKKDANL